MTPRATSPRAASSPSSLSPTWPWPPTTRTLITPRGIPGSACGHRGEERGGVIGVRLGRGRRAIDREPLRPQPVEVGADLESVVALFRAARHLPVHVIGAVGVAGPHQRQAQVIGDGAPALAGPALHGDEALVQSLVET